MKLLSFSVQEPEKVLCKNTLFWWDSDTFRNSLCILYLWRWSYYDSLRQTSFSKFRCNFPEVLYFKIIASSKTYSWKMSNVRQFFPPGYKGGIKGFPLSRRRLSRWVSAVFLLNRNGHLKTWHRKGQRMPYPLLEGRQRGEWLQELRWVSRACERDPA